MEPVVMENQAEIETPTPAEAGTQAVENKGDATTPTVTGDGEQPTAEPTEEVAAEEEGKKPPRGVQKRLDELTREKYEWKREADYWRDFALQNQQKPQDQAQQDRAGQEAAAEEAPKKPNPDNYENYNDYVEALTGWKVGEQIRRNQEEAAKREREALRISEQQRIAEGFAKNVEIAKTKYADYEDAIEDATNAPCTSDMLNAMMESPQGAEVMYYLAKNPQEAARIAKLTPHGQAREIGRIEARLATPPKAPEPRRITNTNEPPKTVSGAGVVERDPDKMSMDDYAAWRMKQA